MPGEDEHEAGGDVGEFDDVFLPGGGQFAAWWAAMGEHLGCAPPGVGGFGDGHGPGEPDGGEQDIKGFLADGVWDGQEENCDDDEHQSAGDELDVGRSARRG